MQFGCCVVSPLQVFWSLQVAWFLELVFCLSWIQHWTTITHLFIIKFWDDPLVIIQNIWRVQYLKRKLWLNARCLNTFFTSQAKVMDCCGMWAPVKEWPIVKIYFLFPWNFAHFMKMSSVLIAILTLMLIAAPSYSMS